MNHPNLLYFTNAEAAQDLEAEYGPQLERLSHERKLVLLHALASRLLTAVPPDADAVQEAGRVAELFEGVPPQDLLGTIHAIASWEFTRVVQTDELVCGRR